jgi:hypothetical protein
MVERTGDAESPARARLRDAGLRVTVVSSEGDSYSLRTEVLI